MSGPDLLRPTWAAPAGVQALMTLRGGGHSAAPYDSFNLSLGVGDDPNAVAANRAQFVTALDGARPTWMRQVHGRDVLRITTATPLHPAEPFDAAWTTEPLMACMVGAADCMPVLLAARSGLAVGAAHAGWRGLAAGVLESTVAAMCDGAGLAPSELVAWMGPCIGPRQFEVGADVLDAFGQAHGSSDAFVPHPRPDGTMRWLANLPALARQRLEGAGVRDITDAALCTVEGRSRFFSHRRDRVSGRMVAAIWRS